MWQLRGWLSCSKILELNHLRGHEFNFHILHLNNIKQRGCLVKKKKKQNSSLSFLFLVLYFNMVNYGFFTAKPPIFLLGKLGVFSTLGKLVRRLDPFSVPIGYLIMNIASYMGFCIIKIFSLNLYLCEVEFFSCHRRISGLIKPDR